MLLRSVDWLFYELLKLSADSQLVQAVHFFVYDSIKILLLLFVMIFVIGVIRTFLPEDRIRQWMQRRSFASYLFAALFGAVTPFCSCSSIPIFFSFLKAGIPLGVGFAFLVTSPLINEYLVVLMAGFFGWKIAVLYVISGIAVGTVTGLILGRMNLNQHIVADFLTVEGDNELQTKAIVSFAERVKFGWEESVTIVRKIWVWVLVGVGIGAVIHNYVPQDAIEGLMRGTGIFSVPLATLAGVPLYGSCAAIVPIAVVLFQKGIPLGTALSFMMAVAALSLPEAVMLRRAMRLQLILIFFAVTTIAIIFTGYLFNAVQGFLI